MISNRHIIVGLGFCAFTLWLGVSSAKAINNFSEELQEQRSEQNADGQPGNVETQETGKGLDTIHAEVLQVEDDKYLVRKYDGDVIRLQIDNNTQLSGSFTQGDRIVAEVNDQRQAISIRHLEQ